MNRCEALMEQRRAYDWVQSAGFSRIDPIQQFGQHGAYVTIWRELNKQFTRVFICHGQSGFFQRHNGSPPGPLIR